MTSFLAILASSWGIVMAIAPVMQIRRMIVARSSADVSLGYWVVKPIGFSIWAVYGLQLRNLAIVLPNVIAFCVSLSTIGVAVFFGRQKTGCAPGGPSTEP